MDIVSLLYVLCVIPIAGIISAVIMLLKDVHKYRKSFLKRLLITALIALLLLGISLLPGQSESFAGFWIVGLPLTNLGPGGRDRLGFVAAYSLPCMVELVRDMQFFHGRRETFVRQE